MRAIKWRLHEFSYGTKFSIFLHTEIINDIHEKRNVLIPKHDVYAVYTVKISYNKINRPFGM